MATMTTDQVMDADPFTAIMNKSRQELKAVLQQTEAARQTLRAFEDTLKSTQAQVADLQVRASASADKLKASEAGTAEMLRAAKSEAAGIVNAARLEAKRLVDEARGRLRVALAHLEPTKAEAA